MIMVQLFIDVEQATPFELIKTALFLFCHVSVQCLLATLNPYRNGWAKKTHTNCAQ